MFIAQNLKLFNKNDTKISILLILTLFLASICLFSLEKNASYDYPNDLEHEIFLSNFEIKIVHAFLTKLRLSNTPMV